MPDIRITLYSLDVDAINQAYVLFKETKKTWALFASTYFFKNKDRQNCSGLTADLLKEGGIDKLAVLYADTFFQFAHHGLIGHHIEAYLGKTALSVIRSITLIGGLYLTGGLFATPPII